MTVTIANGLIIILASWSHSAAHQEPEEMSYESDGEDENGDEDWDGEDSVSEKADKKAKKAGRKAKWSQSLLDDTIDIIISSGYYKKKHIH